MDRVLNPLLQMNANICGVEGNYTPLIIKPSEIKGMTYTMEVASAQVKVLFYLQAFFKGILEYY